LKSYRSSTSDDQSNEEQNLPIPKKIISWDGPKGICVICLEKKQKQLCWLIDAVGGQRKSQALGE